MVRSNQEANNYADPDPERMSDPFMEKGVSPTCARFLVLLSQQSRQAAGGEMAGIDEVHVRAEDDYAFEGDIADDGNLKITLASRSYSLK